MIATVIAWCGQLYNLCLGEPSKS